VTQEFDVSVVTAVYDVARYLPEFTASLEAQRGVDLSRIEVVAVDDGSTDDSLEVLRAWAARSRLAVTVLTKTNGGQGSARNLGLDAARGAWVTFLDPDDTVAPDYLARVLGFVAEHPTTEMVATARWMLDEASGSLTDTHPLAFMFSRDELVDLDQAPLRFHGSAPAAFFRRTRLLESRTTFDDRIRPNFEDGHFCTRYLLTCDRPLVAFLGSAHYVYRKRADGSSTLNSSLLQPERYTQVPRYGYLDVLQRSADKHGGRPQPWVQNLVLYELSWYLGAEASMAGSQTACVGEVARVFLQDLREVVTLLDPEVVDAFAIRPMQSVWRVILEHGVQGDTWRAPYAVVGPTDAQQRLVRVIHRYTGAEPRVELLRDGAPVEPVHTKVRAHVYFEHALCHERVSWLPSGGRLEVRVDGRPVDLLPTWPAPKANDTSGTAGNGRLGRAMRDPGAALREVVRRLLRLVLTSGVVGRRYRGAWVLMDRIHDADDSGEHLFHHLREHRPDINAWFVVERGTPDWDRLRPQLGRRLVAHGSARWLLLMLHCAHLVSSHVDKPVHKPERVMPLLPGRRPTWRFSFLQHGVIKDDLSRWLNPKALDLFVTSTPGEQASVVSDGSPYMYTTREARLTGLPRFDRLLAAGARVTPEQRDLVLVCPTWRQWLTPPLEAGSQRRVTHEDFLDSEYAQQWLGLLRSERLAKACAEHGVQVGFLPHPNLSSTVPLLDLPDHVVGLSFQGTDVQELFARAAVLVTDYSSMAFNAAYLDRPVVYFQFDREAVQAGAHVGRAGYFDYARDGFGPLTDDLPAALSAIEAAAARGFEVTEQQRQRNAATFVLRDGRCCERVTAAIEALDRPWNA